MPKIAALVALLGLVLGVSGCGDTVEQRSAARPAQPVGP